MLNKTVNQMVTKKLSTFEFIIIIAINFSAIAFSIDAILPALPEISAVMSPTSPNKTQLVISSFVIGMGIATLFTGPLSDSFGRKKIIFFGGVIYITGALIASYSKTLEIMLLGRFIQGIGVAGPRIVALAIVRDLYEGRRMAQIVSIAMIVFTLVPAVAPMVGALIVSNFGWRSIFIAFILFSIVSIGWLLIRQEETLKPEHRVKFTFLNLTNSIKECFSNKIFITSTCLQAFAFGSLFASLSTIQQIFDTTYNKNDSFPEWFALIALISGLASFANSFFVVKVGMRKLIEIGFLIGIIFSLFLITFSFVSSIPFLLYFIWQSSVFFMIGLMIGNLNALAMQPMGHIAGLAASIIGSISTIIGVMLAIPIGLSFDGTPTPLILGSFILSFLGLLLARKVLN
ncbi:MAG: multidrug effflux MFS transporter [Paracoccaceae bacterium]|nr:multidrug effflux MFS transporter [Paracoccaceae bacterium]